MNRIAPISLIIVIILTACARVDRRAVRIDTDELELILSGWEDNLAGSEGDSTAFDLISEQVRSAADSLSRITDPGALYTAHMGYLLLATQADSTRAEELAAKIRSKYPASRQTWELAGTEFYDRIYPVWNDDDQKIVIIEELMKKYPETGWRRTMYPYLLYSLDQKEEITALKKNLHDFRRAFPEDYLPWYQSAYYYEKNSMDPERALDFAEEAYSRSSGYPFVEFYPSGQWQLERRGATVKTSAVLASLLNSKGKYSESIQLLEAVLSDHELGVEDEITLGRTYYHLGAAFLGIGNDEKAVRMLLNALKAGDSRNRFTPRADSLLREHLAFFDPDPNAFIKTLRGFENYTGVQFTDVTAEYGLDGINLGRVAWGDFNGDGYQDLLLNGSRLFRNQEGNGFQDVTETSLPVDFSANGGLWGDLDNDGDLDIVTKDPETILINYENKFFSSDSSGIADNNIPTEGIGLGDFDLNGYLDIYFANYEKGGSYHQDQIYFSVKAGRFRELGRESGISTDESGHKAGRGVNPADFDNDGDLDIFVSNYRLTDNFLWINNGKGHFVNRAEVYKISGEPTEGWWGHTIGSEWADWDNDGDLDLLSANLAHPRYIDVSDKTMLYENSGAPEYGFRDIRAKTGIRFEETHSEPSWGDLDNDGFLDLYLTAVYEDRRSFLYINDRKGGFRDDTYLAGVRHFNGWGAAFADMDNDGDLDLIVAGGRIQLFRNDTPSRGNWLEIEVIGSTHVDAIGARLELYNDEILMVKEIQGGKGTTNQHSLVQHFGLGDQRPPFTLKVRFPEGNYYTLAVWEINRRISIYQQNN